MTRIEIISSPKPAFQHDGVRRAVELARCTAADDRGPVDARGRLPHLLRRGVAAAGRSLALSGMDLLLRKVRHPAAPESFRVPLKRGD
jgi:hypothetical protein